MLDDLLSNDSARIQSAERRAALDWDLTPSMRGRLSPAGRLFHHATQPALAAGARLSPRDEAALHRAAANRPEARA